jgi:hypothetical protein
VWPETFFGRTASVWDDIIVERRLPHRLSHLAPALVIYLFVGPVLEGYDLFILIVRRIALIYMIVVTLLAIDSMLEVALTTVKVKNWDRTITTIPTYALITESFKNWRGMSESGGDGSSVPSTSI